MSTETEAPAERWRLFLAAAVPASLADQLGRLQSKLKKTLGARGTDFRWMPPENFHVTLFFLGATDPARLPELAAACRELARGQEPFQLEVRGLGAFPEERSGRVLWAGVQNSRQLRGLAERAQAAMVRLGYPEDTRHFHPHLTLARLRNPRSLREQVDLFRRHAFGEIAVGELVLFRSLPAVPYPRYVPLERFPFEPAAS